MNSSDIPSRINKAFAVNGLKNTIPVDSSTSTDNNGMATFDKGFPSITMQPLSAGGIPPSGKDMNGVLYSATVQQQWQNAGMTYPYSQDFSDAISGYPRGALVPNSILTGQWLNLTEGNGNSPESSTGATTGWVPVNSYGITQITMTTGSVVMSSIQASRDRIILTGALTSNVNLIFPSWVKTWTIINNCTGNFNVTLKTLVGAGVIMRARSEVVFCDGDNIYKDSYIKTGSTSSGNWRLSPDGYLYQWGSIPNTSATSGVNITYPIPFQQTPSYTLVPTAVVPITAVAEGTTLSQILNVITFNTAGTQQTNSVVWTASGYIGV